MKMVDIHSENGSKFFRLLQTGLGKSQIEDPLFGPTAMAVEEQCKNARGMGNRLLKEYVPDVVSFVIIKRGVFSIIDVPIQCEDDRILIDVEDLTFFFRGI